MRYLGGKSRLAKRLAAILEAERSPGSRFVEPFAGAWNVTAAMSGERVAADACEPMIMLARAWQDGWRPPPITPELHAKCKALRDPKDPLTAFVGFGCSFGGRYFATYAEPRANGQDYAACAARSLARKMSACAGVQFTHCDFRDLEVRPGDLVYADPPYFGTEARVGGGGAFPYPAFVSSVSDWAALGATVFVSEYAARGPRWQPAQELTTHLGAMSKSKGGQIERLFRVR
jgi:DNA adenine methylase